MKAVILAGGGGKRLWPLSTTEEPKQFQKLLSEKTMVEETIDRLDFLNENDIFVALNKEQLSLFRNILPHFPEQNIIIEPALRDTASCIGYAAAIIEKLFPNEVMAIIYADHLIKNKEEFQKQLKIAEKIAKDENTLNIIEVEASCADTNYGYVKLGEKLESVDGSEIYKLDKFTEKPNKETAEEFIKSGNYLWNTGIYVWKAKTLLEHYKNLQNDSYEKFIKMAEEGQVEDIYPSLEKISIDYAIMEKVDPNEIRIIKAKLDWSDIGNWKAIWENLEKNEDGNIERGDPKLLNCKNSLVYANAEKKTIIIGLDDIIVVDTKNGLLICSKEDSKKIKEML